MQNEKSPTVTTVRMTLPDGNPFPSRPATPEELRRSQQLLAEIQAKFRCACGRPVKAASDWCEERDCILMEPDYEWE